MDRVSGYDIFNNSTKAWNTFSDQIKHLENDLFIMTVNKNKVGEIPQDIQASLHSLQMAIKRVLKERE